MDKVLEMGKTSASGSFHLLIGVAGSTVIMFIGTFILTSVLPVEQVGLYGLALIPLTIISFFRDFGVNYAITNFIAGLRADGKELDTRNIIVSGVIFELISGAIFALLCIAIAQPLALLLSPSYSSELSLYITIVSLSIFAGAMFSAASAVFTGFERMKLNSLTQLLQAAVKSILGPLLVIVGFGVLGAIYAYVAFSFTGAIVGGIILYRLFYRPINKLKPTKCNILETLKPMLRYGLPLTFALTVAGVLPQVYALTMQMYAGLGDSLSGYPATWMIGNYFTATNFSTVLTFISIPISTALFPTFSKLRINKDPEAIKTVFASSIKYSAFVTVPAAVLLITISTPLIGFIFPENGVLQSLFVTQAAPKFPFAPLFLALSCVVYLLALVGSISLVPFLQGLGETKQIMKQSFLTLIFGLPLSYFLVAYFYSLGGGGQASACFAIVGGIIGITIQALPGLIWGLYWSGKKYGVKIDLRSSAKILAASIISAGLTFFIITSMNSPSFVELVVGSVTFFLLYLALAPLIGAVNIDDIKTLKSMISGSKFVCKISEPLFSLMEKICILCHSKPF